MDYSKMTFGRLLDEVATLYPNREGIVFKDERITFAQLRSKVNQLAKGLLSIGIQKGDRVSVLLPNRIEWVLSQFAIAKIGAIMVPINTRYKSTELDAILKQSKSNSLIMIDTLLKNNYVEIIYEVCPEAAQFKPGHIRSPKLPAFRNIICISKKKFEGMYKYNDIFEMGNGDEYNKTLQGLQASILPEDVVNIYYTSGTTGLAKGAMLCHFPLIKKAYDRCEMLDINQEDRVLLFIPLCNVFGSINGLLANITHGACSILQETFEPEETLQLIEKEKCTVMYGVPTMYTGLFKHPNFNKYDKSSLRKGNVSAAFVPPDMIDEIIKNFAFHEIHTGYGLTESSGTLTLTRTGDSLDRRRFTVGRPVPDIELKVIDTETGTTLPRGQKGEICTRGFQVMKGYYENPEETSKIIDKDGWLHTGDLGKFNDDGYLVFQGRIKEMFKSGGFNVFTNEVEEILVQHPKINLAYIIGVPDKELGEVGMAFIDLKKGESCSSEEVMEFLKKRIAKYKIPKYVKFQHEFPITLTGKVQKNKLREEAMKELALMD